MLPGRGGLFLQNNCGRTSSDPKDSMLDERFLNVLLSEVCQKTWRWILCILSRSVFVAFWVLETPLRDLSSNRCDPIAASVSCSGSDLLTEEDSPGLATCLQSLNVQFWLADRSGIRCGLLLLQTICSKAAGLWILRFYRTWLEQVLFLDHSLWTPEMLVCKNPSGSAVFETLPSGTDNHARFEITSIFLLCPTFHGHSFSSSSF